jgi:7-cyano-7-deazaguanine synthase
MKAMQQALTLGTDRPFTVETPLMWLDKAATWELAHRLGGDTLVDIIREDTHTCYRGERGLLHAWGHGCGTCPACELRAKGHAAWMEQKAA